VLSQKWINAAEIGTSNSGKPKLIFREQATHFDQAIVVLRSPIGFRGSNAHSAYGLLHQYCFGKKEVQEGWVLPVQGPSCGWKADNLTAEIDTCPNCGGDAYKPARPATMPGKVLVKGYVAEGAAGRAGGGDQPIVLLPKDQRICVQVGGRLYGSPSKYVTAFDGQTVVSLSEEQWILRADQEDDHE
jgi:hypothetical protein